MLPKLQQSSLAQSLRRDNLASQIQCKLGQTKAKISSKTSSVDKTMTATNHGRTITHPKTHIPPLVISQKNIYPKRNSKMSLTNQFMNLHYPVPLANTPDITATEEKLQAPFRRKVSSKNLYQNQEPSRKEIFLLLNSDGTMIEVIFPLELTIRTLFRNSSGKSQSNPLTIIIICLFSLMEPERSMTLIVPLQFWELMISWRKVAIKFFL